eukprot:SAG11_NODE_4283_length_1969_cov_1.498930_2_plen_111_part_00
MHRYDDVYVIDRDSGASGSDEASVVADCWNIPNTGAVDSMLSGEPLPGLLYRPQTSPFSAGGHSGADRPALITNSGVTHLQCRVCARALDTGDDALVRIAGQYDLGTCVY